MPEKKHKPAVNMLPTRGRFGRKAIQQQRRRRRGELASPLLKRFSVYLGQRREKERLSVRELARLSQMPYSNISQFELANKVPRLTELEQLAAAFEEPLDQFLAPLFKKPEKTKPEPVPESVPAPAVESEGVHIV